MLAVGIRELKAKLGEYVRKARAGEVVLVTDRGEVVAELRQPLTMRELPEILQGLVPFMERGEVILGAVPDPSAYRSPSFRLPAGTAQSLLDEERGEV